MDMQSVSAFAPATVANVGPGFDSFGFALESPGDIVEVRRAQSHDSVRLLEIRGTASLPMDVGSNVASAVIMHMMRSVRPDFGIDVVLEKNLPIGSGMGSSASSAVAAAVAANRILREPFGTARLLEYCREGEKVACGTAHADNVAASLYGGFTVVLQADPSDIIRIPAPHSWTVIVAHPHVEVKTKDARAVLPEHVPLKDVAHSIASASAVMVGLCRGDIEMFGRAVMAESLITPRRAARIPSYEKVVRAARKHGAHACGISGSGPSVFAITDQARDVAVRIGAAMRAVWDTADIETDIHIGRFGAQGARVFREEELWMG